MTKDALQKLSDAAKSQPIVGYFGYGSLVNANTLRTSYIASLPATLNGWLRMWDMPTGTQFDGQTVSLLTARRDDNQHLDGVIVFDLAENLAEVDKREHQYQRHTLKVDDFNVPDILSQTNCEIYVYEAIETDIPPQQKPPILQSYLDAVLQGFLMVYGEEGVKRFVHNTANFDTPILQDREAPNYPRAVNLSSSEQALFDNILRQRPDISFIR